MMDFEKRIKHMWVALITCILMMAVYSLMMISLYIKSTEDNLRWSANIKIEHMKMLKVIEKTDYRLNLNYPVECGDILPKKIVRGQ